MGKIPLISVVIPSYKHGHLIGRAIQSVIDQSYNNWEVIVVDNHCQDKTEQVVSAFADKRIHFLKINNRGIIAASRNLGIQAAQGEFIAFLDSDDWWDSSKLKICLQQAEAGVDVIYHKLKCYKVNSANEISFSGGLGFRDVSDLPYEKLLQYGPSLTTSAIIVRKSCLLSINGLDENMDLVGGEDYDLWLRLASAGYGFKLVNSFLGYYLVGGVHVSAANKSLSILNCLQKKYFDSKFLKLPIWIHKSIFVSYLKLGQYKLAINYLLKIYNELSFNKVGLVFFIILKTIFLRVFCNIRTIS